MAHTMYLWISKMYHALFNGFPERLNADCLPPSIENTGVFTFLLLIFVPFFLFSINMEGLCG